MPKCCDDSRILNWGSVLGQMFLKSHQIPNFEKYETRANYLKKDIGLGPTLFPRVHSRFKIRFGIINIAQSWPLIKNGHCSHTYSIFSRNHLDAKHFVFQFICSLKTFTDFFFVQKESKTYLWKVLKSSSSSRSNKMLWIKGQVSLAFNLTLALFAKYHTTTKFCNKYSIP